MRRRKNLKAWYGQLCKRPCFHDSYLQAFNTPGTHLVDTDGKGVERITANGIVVAGREYQLDCIIYASGFEVGTEYKRRAGFDLSGRGGVKLSEHWGEGMRTKHGIHVHGFPNAVLRAANAGRQSDFQRAAQPDRGGAHHRLDGGPCAGQRLQQIEVSKNAEDRWVELLLTGGRPDDQRPRLHARLLQQ